MDKFIKALEEHGIKDIIKKVLDKNPDASLAEVIENEISKDENLEDIFLQEAHKCAMETICQSILER